MKSVGGAMFIMLIPPKRRAGGLIATGSGYLRFFLLITVWIIHANREDFIGMDGQSHVTSLNRQR